MFYIFTFPEADDTTAEAGIPLLFHGQHLLKKGWTNDINLIFMRGFEKLSPGYKDRLREVGFNLADKGEETAEIKKHYPQLSRFNDFICYCFLRWVLLADLVEKGEITLPVIVLGGDVIFTADPQDIQKDVQHKTFVLQGCPDFTVISDYRWLQVYRQEFATLIEGPGAYTEAARRLREHPSRPDREFCNLSAYEIPFRHDQDLHEYLIAVGKLPQSKTQEVFGGSPFYWIQNPLFPDEWFPEQDGGIPKNIINRHGHLFVGHKQIPFIHFQNDFSWYCYLWKMLDKFNLNHMNKIIIRDISRNMSFPGKVFSYIMKILAKLKKNYSRRNICDFVFQYNNKTGNLFITDIVNSLW